MKRIGFIRFPPFELDLGDERLLRGTTVVPLRPKAFAVLRHLAERPRRLVTKEELLDAVWPDTHVSDTVLKVCIREVREALGDDPAHPRFVETAHRRGYRFVAATPSDLPRPLSRFIGRETELRELLVLLGERRLVTLTGQGGAGKTRLALEAAARHAHAVGVSAHWVDLAPCADPSLVPERVAQALGVREVAGRPLIQALLDVVGSRERLIVVDNCEHLLDGCAALVEVVLLACPAARVMATSREPLGVAGETIWAVPPFDSPHPGAAPAQELIRFDAVRLFVDRASAASPSFALAPDNGAAVAQICRRLDGLPLAIELAASRVRVLTPEQIAARLDDRFALLTSGSRTSLPRQQTLRATMDWSFELLTPPERALLRRLSAFAGTFALEAVEAVGAGDGIAREEILDLLTHLVDKSLVVAAPEPGDVPRFRLLETVRAYAAERLEEAREGDSTRSRHAAFFRPLAERAEPKLNGADRPAWLRRLDADHDNLRTALAWAREEGGGGAEGSCSWLGLRLAGALWWYWLHRGHWTEGRGWLESYLGAAAKAPVEARAKALCGAGVLAWAQGERETARARLEASVSAWRTLRQPSRLGEALTFLGQVCLDQGELPVARRVAEESVAAHGTPRDWGGAVALNNLGNVARAQEDPGLAREAYLEAARLLREIGDGWALSMALRNLGVLASRQGDDEEGARLFQESLAELRELDERWFVSRGLEELAAVRARQGHDALAARLFGAGEGLREAIGAPVLPMYRADYDRGVAGLRAKLGPALEAHWREGRELHQAEAIALALGEPPRRPT